MGFLKLCFEPRLWLSYCALVFVCSIQSSSYMLRMKISCSLESESGFYVL